MESLYHKFQDRSFTNRLFGEVDDFWETKIEPKITELNAELILKLSDDDMDDVETDLPKITYIEFMKEFVEYFLDEEDPRVKRLSSKTETTAEERRIDKKYIIKWIEKQPSTLNRQTVAFRLFLNCEESYNTHPDAFDREFLVTREGYSKAYGLIKHIMYNNEKNHKIIG